MHFMSQQENDAGGASLGLWLRGGAQRHADAVALESPQGEPLTYRELASAVAARARSFADAGLQPGERIAVAATRSTDTVISILAAADAGMAYVPLDLAYPAERLRAMLDDAQPRAVVGDAEALSTLRALVGELPTLEQPSALQAPLHASAPDLTYVLFTSGSTGRPKGVAMGSEPLRHLIQWHADHPRLGQPARTLQFAPLSFDVHFQEIFSTLACGGTLVLVPEEQRRDPGLLLDALIQRRIERIFVPYVALQMIAQASRDAVPTSLRDVVSAGEQLQVTPAIRSLFERLPGSELHNHYGPTESHVVTAHELRGDPATWPEIPPIGRALPHVQLALVPSENAGDEHTGELLLGGQTLAWGYLGRPELTQERFRTDIPGLPGRWYVTGDLARRDTDGVYTYLGRADQQLKVDGFRIEPGEIELAIMAQAGIQDAVVTAPDLPGIGKQLVAHLVLGEGAPADTSGLITRIRAELRAAMPEYMVPVRFVVLDRLPTTPSGKIDRKGLPLPAMNTAAAAPSGDPLSTVRGLWQELLGLPALGDDQNLFDLGARSLLVMRFVTRLKDLGIQGLNVADVYDKPTVAGIAAALAGPVNAPRRQRQAAGQPTAGIAIVGMATRTPGARRLDDFWQNLIDGQEGIRQFSLDEIDPSVPASVRSRPNFVAAHGVLDGVEHFDAGFFGISAREATMLDPQQRLMLELSVSALEHAAIDASRTDARIGVYAGTGNNAYAPALRSEQPELVQQYGEFATMLASEKDYVATRVANRLNLNGPALSIHTACSTSLVAVAQAWHALASGQCDVALAGGINVAVPQASGYLHVEGGMESADGHCRPFDADASGTVFASGGGVVVLRRLEDALAQGDTVYAVIRGVGLNNDGGDKASFTAPSVTGQMGAIRMALDQAGVSARQIGYVEAHGTGTSLGDPIEVAALTRAWREDTADSQYCGIGSVKSNLGHMAAGAGVVGLIKAALSLHHGVIPATLHYRQPNPQIDFENTPFRVVAQNTPWPRGSQSRLAAVSSFGVGGTNAHVVIEEAPARPAPATNEGRWLLPVSARTADAALQRARDLADHLERHPELALGEVAATLMRGRKPMAQRLSVVAASAQEAIARLRAAKSSVSAMHKPRLVFLFPGQGSQHPGMARQLVDEVPAFREAFDRALPLAEAALGVDLRAWLVSADPADAEVARQLAQTHCAQPALFSVSYALAAWLDSLGIRPDAMIGHSIGEYAAACHAGVLSLEDAMAAVIARGQAMFEQPPGAMLAVRAGLDAVRALLPEGIEVAGCNAPALTVVAGGHEAIDRFAQSLEKSEIDATRLRVSHAFHSASMEGALPRVSQALAQARLRAPSLTVYSCVSGAPLQAHEATDPGYWARQVRAPVQFSKAVMAELAQGDAVFLEVGPGQALTALLRQHRTPKAEVPRIVPMLGAAQDPGQPAEQGLAALGALWGAGIEPAWPVAATARRAPLPTYPFQNDRHWFARRTAPAGALPSDLSPSVASAVTMSRIPTVEHELKRVLSDVSGIPADDMTTDASFVDQGLDSLSLTQATLELERVFGVKLRFRRLMEDLDNIGKLARFLDTEMPAGKFAPPAPVAPVAAAPAVAAVMPTQVASFAAPAALSPSLAALPAGTSAVHQLLQQQMQLMAQQLAVLAGQPMAAALPVAPLPVAPAPTASAPAAVAVAKEAEPAQPSIKSLVEKPFGASPRLTLEARQDFTPAQRRWLDEFITRYNARSGKSKAFSQQHRKVMADPRVVTGFNPLYKDLVYPIVVNRSQGANLWDLDGNEYIDLLSCFGGNLLGYQPPKVIEAMQQQLQLGLEVGPQHPYAADVAQLISEFTGMERVGFCNTGSEAVMGAMRIARTVTGRKTIAIFTNSYHGIFDEVIVRGTKQLRSLSAAPGILANAVENILVLDWNSEDSLRVLRERGPELAAIMTEPIQNKYPTLQPREFVQSLRQIADQAGCALIFDEVVTGFRVAPGGAQEFYGVRADIATYGKVIGGGLPFAAIAGNANWLDALDGGHWQYGDDSYPEAGVTYFAGTFVRHPLALAAARATLQHIKAGGREFYRNLNDRTQRLIDRLNTAFAVRGAPVKAVHCASIWRLQWDDNQKHISLFYYLVRYHGLHLYEQFGHFVTEGMTDAHTDRIFQVFTDAMDELMGLGFITPKDGSPPPPSGPQGGTRAGTDAQLSPGQTERWLAGGFDPSARLALNESFCVSLQGGVDRTALKAALQDVLTRHEAFRLQFDLEEPRQRVVPQLQLAVAEIDLSAQPDAEQALDDFCTQASLRDFPLDQAPLAAVSLLTLADGRTVVHVVASHLVFDGWASSVFNAELATAYKARSMGMAPDFKPAESPLDFAEEEQARFEGPDGQEALNFWQQLLQNPPAPLNLGDRTPQGPRSYAADTLRIRLDGELFSRLRAQARQSGATLFQVLLTAVTRMLHKRSGQSDFVVSIPYASQSLQRRGPLMADGVLDLPLRLSCQPGESTEAVLQRVRSRLMDALEYPLMTQGTVARALGIRSAGDRPPLTGIFFNLNPKVDLSAYAPLQAAMHEGRKRGTLSELFFNFYEQNDALTLDLHHSSEFFSPQRAQELIDALRAEIAHFAQHPGVELPVLTAVVAPAHAPVRSAPPAPAPDPRLIAWNQATAMPLEPRARVEQWISRQAAATPDAVALVAHGVSLSYAALESRANRFGHLLRSRGIGAGMRVGVCLTRGPNLVPALLGILKTGAAYVPLDPGFPKDRLRDMAEDAGVRLVITDAANAGLSGVPREQQIRIDDDAAAIASASDSALPRQADWADDAPMYVIYTSGSTGKPKGVVLPQNAVCNFLASMRREPGLQAGDRLLAVTTLSFDIAVLELFLPLTVGASVVLAQREDAMDGEVLGRLAAEQRINVMQATPTTWHMLLDAGWRAPAGFRALCGGEPLPPSLARRLLDAGVELWNMYGPTETTVWSTLCRITDATQKITIGHPIANTQVWVLDEQMKPVAIGQEGELCIGGAGVATGYFKRPELTAEKFVADPFDTATPGARIYRTGDLARWREDGTLEHLGRLDFQVKIRGYRIELGEIEARLAALPGIARTVVMAREDSPGDVRLIGYAVPHAGQQADAAALREALRTGLPDYMLPQQIVLLDTMPLLPNGKIDRKALPAPTGPAPSASSAAVKPARNDTEKAVVEAMQAVLKLPAVGVDEDFFFLGGHSLLAAKLMGQINKAFGLQLNLRVLFESTTAEKLARLIDQQRGDTAPAREPLVHRADQRQAPLTLMQERIRFIEAMQPGRTVYNAPSAHRLRGPMDLQAFDRAFQEVVKRQPALHSAIVSSAQGPVQKNVELPAFSLLPLEDLGSYPAGEQEAVLQERLAALADQAFSLEHAPLFKARLFRLADDHHVLFFMTHHVIWDGWSFDLLYDEMNALYQAFSQGQPSPLAPLALTYGDFADWHARWLESDELQDQLTYWKKQFLGKPVQEPLADLARLPGMLREGATESMHIAAEQADRVRDIAKRTGSTLSIVALSVYAVMVSQLLREPAPTIGLPVRGRPTPELDPIMGFFNNMLPVRLPVDTSLSWLDWIGRVRAAVVEAFAHQDVPFERIAHALEAEQPGVHARLYQCMFSFQDARNRPTHWGPLAHERVRIKHKGATEDLNLWLVEIPSGIEGGIQYDTHLYLPATAKSLHERFVALLDAVARTPTQTVAQLMAPTPADQARAQALDAPAAAPAQSLFDLLEQRASALTPPALLRVGSTELDARELVRRVTEHAAQLKAKLPTEGHPLTVAIAMQEPVAQLVTALAVLRLGHQCLPLMPGDTPPADAVAFGDAPWLQSQPAPSVRKAAARPQAFDATLVAQIGAGLARQAHLLVGDCLRASAHATGTALALLGLALHTGGRLVLWDQAPDGATLVADIQRERTGLVFADANTWADALQARRGASISVIAAVDARDNSPELVAQLLDAGLSVLNVLQTDTLSLPLAVHWVADPAEAGLVGRPLVAHTVRIAPQPDSAAPIGVSAPVWVKAGPAAAWAASHTSARWRSDGLLQQVSDPDEPMVLLGGALIDLDALEQAALALPGVEMAATQAVVDAGGRRRLVIGLQAAGLSAAQRESHVRALLDALPIEARAAAEPRWFEQIVRHPGGRLQLAQSRALRAQASRAGDAFAGTATEQAIHAVWSELLGMSHIGRNDNFFDLGGTSLTAMQAVLKLEQQIGKQISPRRYVSETLAQLAVAYDATGAAQPASAPAEAAEPAPGLMKRLARLVQRA
jgi:amino acid adenylation domain-containing protein